MEKRRERGNTRKTPRYFFKCSKGELSWDAAGILFRDHIQVPRILQGSFFLAPPGPSHLPSNIPCTSQKISHLQKKNHSCHISSRKNTPSPPYIFFSAAFFKAEKVSSVDIPLQCNRYQILQKKIKEIRLPFDAHHPVVKGRRKRRRRRRRRRGKNRIVFAFMC
uniref:Uncharacterized protein n=1 Tax=Sphaerodactylus townsendi TaxID=933632 RepID=A0ACB8EVL9_9SAUR